jgi:hypothetical protein
MAAAGRLDLTRIQFCSDLSQRGGAVGWMELMIGRTLLRNASACALRTRHHRISRQGASGFQAKTLEIWLLALVSA